MKKIILFFILIISALSLFSQEKIDAQRPTQSESYSIIDKYIFQAENGVTFSSDTATYSSFLRYSVANVIELRASTDYGSRLLTPGIKCVLLRQGDNRPGISLLASFDMKGNVTDYRAALSHKLSEQSTVTLNLGKDNDFYGILIFVRSLGETGAGFVEAYIKEGYQQYNAGLIVIPHPDVQIDFSTGLIDYNDFYLGAGVSFRVK
ncbi:MAG: hypothetical protein COA57_07110 [Flavobacteriales bacterium]|nr:MAG: hypothetical protein COA57_07110 [Flavobacteriales bacterium]